MHALDRDTSLTMLLTVPHLRSVVRLATSTAAFGKTGPIVYGHLHSCQCRRIARLTRRGPHFAGASDETSHLLQAEAHVTAHFGGYRRSITLLEQALAILTDPEGRSDVLYWLARCCSRLNQSRDVITHTENYASEVTRVTNADAPHHARWADVELLAARAERAVGKVEMAGERVAGAIKSIRANPPNDRRSLLHCRLMYEQGLLESDAASFDSDIPALDAALAAWAEFLTKAAEESSREAIEGWVCVYIGLGSGACWGEEREWG
jgi:hypothetical protein